jgi:hypothetical protein
MRGKQVLKIQDIPYAWRHHLTFCFYIDRIENNVNEVLSQFIPTDGAEMTMQHTMLKSSLPSTIQRNKKWDKLFVEFEMPRGTGAE